MKLSLHKNTAKIGLEDLDDLWYLKDVIEVDDRIEGATFRKIKKETKDERSGDYAKKKVYLSILLEKIDYTGDRLRLSGKVVNSNNEDIPNGSYHSFNLGPGETIKITKTWSKYQLDRLKEGQRDKSSFIIVAFDREEAYFWLLTKKGYRILTSIKGNVAKKEVETKNANFYAEIIKHLTEYINRYNCKAVVASPSFWKDYLLKECPNELRKKLIIVGCSDVSAKSIEEILKREDAKSALSTDRNVLEISLVERLFLEIQKDGLAAYGFDETKNCVNYGNVAQLLVTNKLLQALKVDDEKKAKDLENIMKTAESAGGAVHIINSELDQGKRLDGLGGIGAVLRYKI